MRPGDFSRARAIAAACLAFGLVLLDASALNVALPSVQRDLGASPAALEWVLSGYSLTVAGLLLSAGSLCDRLGAGRAIGLSAGGFALASVVCAASPVPAVLVAARALQGAAAAGLLPASLALIATVTMNGDDRAKALSWWGICGSLALLAGPLAGALATISLGWRAIFALNVPLATVVVLLARRAPAAPAAVTRARDPLAQISAALAAIGIVGAVIELGARRLVPGAALAVIGRAAATWLVRIEHESEAPLLADVLRCRAPAVAIAASGLYQFGAYGLQFLLTLRLQDAWHLSPLATGLAFAPLALAWCLGNALSARLAPRHSPPARITVGAVLAGSGSLGLLALELSDRWVVLIAGTSLVGLGAGLIGPALPAIVLAQTSESLTGTASSILHATRQLGGAVGVAVLGTVLAITTSRLGAQLDATMLAGAFLTIAWLAWRLESPLHPLNTQDEPLVAKSTASS